MIEPDIKIEVAGQVQTGKTADQVRTAAASLEPEDPAKGRVWVLVNGIYNTVDGVVSSRQAAEGRGYTLPAEYTEDGGRNGWFVECEIDEPTLEGDIEDKLPEARPNAT
jgi:hypothetical protein